MPTANATFPDCTEPPRDVPFSYMMDLSHLVSLADALKGARVLSVYVDRSAADPAGRRSWRVELDHSLDNLRTRLDGSERSEREEFEQCARLLEKELKMFTPNGRMPGWAAFITADRVQEASPLPVVMPTQALWSTGPSVAAYMRALKEIRPVVVVRVDSTRASVYKYSLGKLERVTKLRAYHTVRKPSHMSAPPRVGFHSGTRGDTGHDEAQRSLLAGTKRMLSDAVEDALRIAGADGWIVTGGIPGVSRHLADMLASRAPHRVLHDDSLDIHASKADVAAASRAAASRLRNEMDSVRVAEILEGSNATGLGAMGPAATSETLEQRRVRELYFTHQYLENHPDAAEAAVRSAIDQGALIEEVSGAAAEQLDAHGGMAARLRYRLAQNSPSALNE